MCPSQVTNYTILFLGIPSNIFHVREIALSKVFETNIADQEMKYFVFRMLIRIWNTISVLSIFLSLIMSSVVFLDLYFTLKNPFYPREKRNPYFILFTLILMGASTLIVYQ